MEGNIASGKTTMLNHFREGFSDIEVTSVLFFSICYTLHLFIQEHFRLGS